MAAYYIWSGATGSANGTSWADAYTTLTLAFAGKSAGDVFYVAHDHSESTAASITLTPPGTVANPGKIICVDRGGTVPPVPADRRTTGQVATTGSTSSISFAGAAAHYDGIIFYAGLTSGTSAGLQSGANTSSLRFDNCSFRMGGSTGSISVGNNGIYSGGFWEFNNTTVQFGGVSGNIAISGTLRWRNTPSALLGANIPATLFLPQSRGGEVECVGVDLSAAGSGKTIVGAQALVTAQKYRFIDCKLNASVTKSTVPAAHGATEVDFVRSGASGNYTVYRHRMSGELLEEIAIVRTGGASDGTTPIGWKVNTTANCNYSMPFECPPIAIWNDTTGSAKIATVEGIWGGGAVPNDDDVWLDVEYLGDAASPQGSFVNDGKANLLATGAAQTTSSATWGGSTTKFKFEVTFTSQQKGWIYCRIKVGKPSSTFYLDPLVTLS